MDNTEIKILELPKILDRRGNLSFVEQLKHIPFEIKRSYWIYDVPGGAERGGHAYRKNDFDVVLNDGKEEKIYHLNRSYYGLYVPRMIWRSMRNFSTNSLALVVSSIEYDENDYIRNFSLFQEELKR